jgi:hypothetical protein
VDSRIDSSSGPRSEVRAEYSRRLEARTVDRNAHVRLEYALGNYRLLVAAIAIVVAWFALRDGWFSAGWIALPVAAFIGLAVRHDRIIRERERLDRSVQFYEGGLLRLDDCWAGSGVSGQRFAGAGHPYSIDLDLFGIGSLFELICSARTVSGEDCLADWLGAPAPPDVVRLRQEAVAELRPQLDLREAIALLGEEVRSGINPRALTEWGAEQPILDAPVQRILTTLLGAAVLSCGVLWALGYGWRPFAVAVIVAQLEDSTIRRHVKRVVRAVEKPAKDLEVLSELLARIESAGFRSERLRELQARLLTSGTAPSRRIARLQSLVAYLDSTRNQIVAPLAAALLWTTQCAFAIERWRLRSGPELGDWLQTVGEFEALCSLARYAFERPENSFPELVDGAVLRATYLAHPLLPLAGVVRNDIALDERQSLLLVSGSNMSGKSTLLRTVGVNTVLALAGAPVCASRFEVGPLQVGASIRTQDSLAEGISAFYAEIKRLRQIVDLATDHAPALFLLDEILHGTNSHDRRIGAEAVVRGLLARSAVGIVTTHDLALARIAEDTGLHAVNVHFEDHLEEGRMTFDYRLRPGVVRKSNALELMRSVGLEV